MGAASYSPPATSPVTASVFFPKLAGFLEQPNGGVDEFPGNAACFGFIAVAAKPFHGHVGEGRPGIGIGPLVASFARVFVGGGDAMFPFEQRQVGDNAGCLLG